LPTGACGDDTTVAYVASAAAGGTVNTSCTKATPCTTVANGLATNRPYIKISGTIDEAVVVNDKAVTFLADPGAKLTRSTAGVIMTINGASPVTIYDLEVTAALGASTGIGISATVGSNVTLDNVKVTGCASTGISATTATLTATRTSVIANTGGGISLTGSAFDLTNNVIAKNGSGSTAFGGLSINQLGTGAHVLDFNTISGNVGATGVTTGVVCSLVTQAVTFSNNIIYANSGSGAGTQVSGNNCAYTYSDIGPDTVTGTGNANTDPMFVNASQNNFHLLTGSLVKDAADPGAVLAVDLDGDTRPQGAARDMGADEYK
jgi:hypothetical protein